MANREAYGYGCSFLDPRLEQATYPATCFLSNEAMLCRVPRSLATIDQGLVANTVQKAASIKLGWRTSPSTQAFARFRPSHAPTAPRTALLMHPRPGKARTLDSFASSSHSRPEAPEAQTYAKALYGAGYGYPVYESDQVEQDLDINVGSVVRVDESGKVSVLFTAVQLEHGMYPDARHTAPLIPGCSSLPSGVVPRTSWTRIQSPVIVDARHVTIDGMGGARSLESLHFEDTKPTVHIRQHPGACVALAQPALTLMYGSSAKLPIAQCLHENMPYWRKHVNEEQRLILDDEELLFVHGTVKTTSKFCLIFPEWVSCQKGKLGVHLGADSLVDEVSVSFSIGDVISRIKLGRPPREHTAAGNDVITSGGEAIQPPPDKCVFFNYFKAKRRTRAHPRRKYGSDNTRNVQCGGVDPVDVLLDFILEHPAVTTAVASDTDVFALLHGTRFAFHELAQLFYEPERSPQVEVDDNGVGTIAIDWTCVNQDIEQIHAVPAHFS